MTKKTSAAVEAQVANLFNEGLMYRDIAEDVGVPLSTVQAIVGKLINAGVLTRRPQRGAKKLVDDDEVAALRMEGFSGAEIAEKLGVGLTTAHRAIRRVEDLGLVGRVNARTEKWARERLASPDTPPIVRALLENRLTGETLESLTVLTPENDPYRVDTPEKMAAARWLAEEIARLDANPLVRREQWWNRGLHYALLGRPLPDGTVYVNDAKCWEWLDSTASRSARWSGLVPFDRIIDRRNKKAMTLREEWDETPPRSWSSDPRPGLTHALDDIDLMPSVWLAAAAAQPYRIALVAEKSSAGDLLEPLARRYGCDLFTPDGEMTDTLIHRMAKAADADGRPLIVIYFSDCDPSGYQMPISVSRKLQALRDIEFPNLRGKVVQAAMLPAQIIDLGLPESPLKETEKRAGAWKDAWGVEQTELDSLTSLRPDTFEEIAVEAIERWYDTELEAEVERLREEWEEEAKAAVDAVAEGGEQARLRREVEEAIERLREQMQADMDGIELPDIPVMPESDLDPGEVPNTVLDLADDWRTQTRKLIDRKRYVSEDD